MARASKQKKASKKGACSSNTQGAKLNCLDHDRRDETYDMVPSYVNPELSKDNRTVFEDEMIRDKKTIAPLVKKAEELYTEKTHQKCQKSFTPFRESVLHIKPDTTDEELMKFKELAEKTTGWKCIGIYLHEDEGHARSKYIEGQEGFEINHHAHVLWFCQDLQSGKAIRCDRKKLSQMQDDLALATGMERGNKASETGIRHRSSMMQRIVAQENKIEHLDEVIVKSSAQVEELDKDIATKQGQSDTLAKDIGQKKKKLESLNKKIKDMEDRLIDYMKRLAEKAPSLAQATHAMVDMVKNRSDVPSEAQKEAVNAYLEEIRANIGMNAYDTLEHRKIGVQNISIAAINVCTRDELSKMDTALEKIAMDGPAFERTFAGFQMEVIKNHDGQTLARIGMDGIYAYPVTMTAKEAYDYTWGKRHNNEWAMASSWEHAIKREYPTRQTATEAIRNQKRQNTRSRSMGI